jgi:hypothetical protein
MDPLDSEGLFVFVSMAIALRAATGAATGSTKKVFRYVAR